MSAYPAYNCFFERNSLNDFALRHCVCVCLYVGELLIGFVKKLLFVGLLHEYVNVCFCLGVCVCMHVFV